MSDRLQTFIRAITSTGFDSRSVVVDRNTKKAKLGNLIFSEKNEVHKRTMAAFKEALVHKHGIFGSQAFEAVLKDRADKVKPLRVCDIRKTLLTMRCMRLNQFQNELNRQLDSNPLYRCLDSDARRLVRRQINKTTPKQCLQQLSRLTTQAELNRFVQNFINKAVDDVEQQLNLTLIDILLLLKQEDSYCRG